MKRLLIILWQHWTSRLALMFIAFLLIVAFFRDQLASPLGGWLVDFGPNQISEGTASFLPPGATEASGKAHWLGTDGVGRDVAARLIHGSGTVLYVGVLSTIISFLIAVILGILSGYVGDRSWRLNILQIIVIIIILFFGFFYAGQVSFYGGEGGAMSRDYRLYSITLAGFILLAYGCVRWAGKLPMKAYAVPMDFLVIKFMEVFKAIPGLFFILALMSIIASPNRFNVVIIIGILGWPLMTRLLRAEIIRLKESTFVHASRITGISHWRLVVHHILPGALAPLVVAFAFSVSASILIESTLSFLNIGLPQNEPSWGNILSAARQYFPAWWMAVMPGGLIFLTVLAFNAIGDRINGLSQNN